MGVREKKNLHREENGRVSGPSMGQGALLGASAQKQTEKLWDRWARVEVQPGPKGRCEIDFVEKNSSWDEALVHLCLEMRVQSEQGCDDLRI